LEQQKVARKEGRGDRIKQFSIQCSSTDIFSLLCNEKRYVGRLYIVYYAIITTLFSYFCVVLLHLTLSVLLFWHWCAKT